MSDDLGELSPTEQAMIRQHREEEMHQQRVLEFRLKAIQVAAEYEQWFQDNDRGDSFSTFVNEFGYQEPQGSQMHQYVKRICEAATPD